MKGTIIIMLTCPCNVHPLTPHYYIVYRGLHNFHICALKHIRLWVLNVVCEQKYENRKRNQLKIVIFTAEKNNCMLHGRVCVMFSVEICRLLTKSSTCPLCIAKTNQTSQIIPHCLQNDR